MFNRNIRPSKEWSAVLMIAAIIMCVYGVVSVIPSKGAFGVIWTLVAVMIAVFSGINAFGKGFPIYRIDSGSDSAERPTSEKSFQIIQRLYNQGVISKEEYDQLRKDIR